MKPEQGHSVSGRSQGGLRIRVSQRLRRGGDFDRLFQEGQSQAGRMLVMRAAAGRGTHHRCGVIASKKVFRRAVDRNRAKRLMREAFRLEQANLPSSPVDMVILGRYPLLSADIHGVRKEWRYLWGRLASRRFHDEK